MYLIVVNHRDENERKRVDYVVDKWGVPKVRGIVIKVEEINRDFIKEISSKLSLGNIEVYKLLPEEVEIERRKSSLKAVFKDSLLNVERLVSFIMAKRGAVLKERRQLENFLECDYGVYARGGVKVKIILKENNGTVMAEITLEGFENAVRTLKDELIKDLTYFNAEVYR